MSNPIVPPMTVYISSVREQKTNTSYPFKVAVTTEADLAKAAAYDHVCAHFADGQNNRGKRIKAYRSKKTFLSSNCLPMDCDNTNTNPLEADVPESDWKTPEDVRAVFPGVPFYVVYSRNHMKVKNDLPVRPRFHVYFPIDEMKNVAAYEKLKAAVQRKFPAFDDNAIDGARFFFGVESPKVEYFAGDTLINDYLFNAAYLPDIIPSGSRNATMLSYAGKVLKRFGDSEKAFHLYTLASEHCDVPLDDSELNSIWHNAVSFYHRTVEHDPLYLPPEEFELSDSTVYDFEDLSPTSKADNGGTSNDGTVDNISTGAVRTGGKRRKKLITSDDIKSALKSMGITVRLNVITGYVDITGMPEQYSQSNAPNTLPMLLTDYYSKRNIRVSRQIIDDALVLIEDENRFNPVYDMLTATAWDGVDRIAVLAEILNISGSDDNNLALDKDSFLYLRKWLHQCVAMALNSDENPYGADGVLVLQAPQGMGKTFFFKTLSMKSDWFAEGMTLDLDNKDSVIQGTGKWITELGELDSTLKREQSALKAFLTASKDTYRQPYAKVAVNKPRRTSFCATVNPKEFLNDDTGSRRYWVIQPESIDVERLKELDEEWLQQLWTQVYQTLYLPNPQGFRLTDDERKRLEKHNEQFNKPLTGELELKDGLLWDAPIDRWGWRKTGDLISLLNLRYVTPAQIGMVLTKLMEQDDRIRMKTPHNVRYYFLPPKWLGEFKPIEDHDVGLVPD
ncbi:MAG: hypothetical protein K6G33_02145 [Ruminococcus sp.]|uniref:VapE domain-containing protein n=1 Tax=Ruminococcus sp. TaxID=41978 RepID=UPI0025FAD89B|nr:VapE domain-containing protein [Ruminococcus sp.]MCR5599532.1 hypothetical protein [Ruminococcus sp.]